jgi:1-phosphofructokinase
VTSAMVFAPSPLLTITIERKGDDDDVHLHAGGQGFWIARMLAALDIDVALCGTFGGEIGSVIRPLMERAGVHVRPIEVDTENVGYVHDRRSGSRTTIAEMQPPVLSRHEVDELYGTALVAGLDSDVCVLAGTPSRVIPDSIYERLARDLRSNDGFVVADLSGAQLRSVLQGGVGLVKVSHTELADGGWASGESQDELIAAMVTLRSQGAQTVVVSRAEQPALVLDGDEVLQVLTPQLQPLDERGAGDSMTAGIAAGLARWRSVREAVRLGAAAGTLNVTRRGLATGQRDAIEQLAVRVDLRTVTALGGLEPGQTRTATPDELAARTSPAR